MIERRDAGRGKAEQKAVEGEMVVDAAARRWVFVLGCAAASSTAEITQRKSVADCLRQRGGPERAAADIAPKRAQAKNEGNDCVKRNCAEQQDHRPMRHDFVEVTGIARPQRGGIGKGDKADDEKGDTGGA